MFNGERTATEKVIPCKYPACSEFDWISRLPNMYILLLTGHAVPCVQQTASHFDVHGDGAHLVHSVASNVAVFLCGHESCGDTELQ